MTKAIIKTNKELLNYFVIQSGRRIQLFIFYCMNLKPRKHRKIDENKDYLLIILFTIRINIKRLIAKKETFIVKKYAF